MRPHLLITIAAFCAACSFEAVKPPPGYTGEACIFSCESVGKNCGEIDNGCGGTAWCGACADGEVCGAAGLDNVCCTPTTCAEQGATCGQLSDGCGGVLNCGDCADGENCGAAGPNQCGEGECQPLTCETLGFDCGTANDGCGGVLECGTCSGDESCGAGGVPNRCGADEVFEIPDELEDHCFGWPEQEFSPSNFTPALASLRAGAEAIDFELRDLSGASHRLSELLATKPVFLQTGSYTCPVYQGKINQTEQLAASYGSDVHFVVIYTVEAHPKTDPSPYRGSVWENSTTEDYRQPTTYEERLVPAAALNLGSNQLLLIDDLTEGAMNPVWCTYGPAPNAAYLIGQDGVIHAAQTWLDIPTMEDAITELIP